MDDPNVCCLLLFLHPNLLPPNYSHTSQLNRNPLSIFLLISYTREKKKAEVNEFFIATVTKEHLLQSAYFSTIL